jgi:hypothetical protein
MLRALSDRPDDQAKAVVQVLASVNADILVLGGVDYDYEQLGLRALLDRLRDAGRDYPYSAATLPVSGRDSGVDVDGDGRMGEPEDAMGYGWFTGDSGLAIVSRVPLGPIEDLGAVLWADVPDSAAADVLSPAALAVIPLATVAHWRVPVDWPAAPFDLLAFTASPPVFDGPEDRNGLRNRDQLAFWDRHLTAGRFARPVLLGRFNVDPTGGQGYRGPLTALMMHPRLQDPLPPIPTTAWTGTPGSLRVDYILPAAEWTVVDSGVLAPLPGEAMAQAVQAAGANRLVWVTISTR